jgi:hypothetical protein
MIRIGTRNIRSWTENKRNQRSGGSSRNVEDSLE